ncbi:MULTISPECIES: RICIN domain-containing protein [unclassified Streptomyces]|uniref:RICIN domain-containing protein n=1 Tax=unclassified Streptomyces TaxID=2593676 RepID=UPI000DBA97F7|nr:RICIN domain-containing protein [Streptomyces sp. PsTaAH-137]MYT73801.1 translation initiation factor IF-2 [Streptomyces sp. SID8367]RAJ89213.1 ricin-type beta-trefoil lectin protein [Streptomyces sp. PsTaAH-137]
MPPPRFSEAYTRKPSRVRIGLMPGRRVFVTVGSVAAVTGAVLGGTALAHGLSSESDPPRAELPASPSASAAESPGSAPSPDGSQSATAGSKSKKEHAEKPTPTVTVHEGAPATVTKPTTGSGGAEKKSSDSSPDTAKKAAEPQKLTGPRGPVKGLAGKCVQRASQGLQLRSCDGGADQVWFFASDGTLRNQGTCLSTVANSTKDGARLTMVGCDKSQVRQWRISPNADVVNVAADKCLDVANAATADGTPLQIAWCSGNSAQKWQTP